MRYSISFLGLVAFAAASDPCHKGLQPLLAPLAKEPAAAKFCAAKFPATVAATTTTSTSEIKSSNPYVFLSFCILENAHG
jgi:hypothetical protein